MSGLCVVTLSSATRTRNPFHSCQRLTPWATICRALRALDASAGSWCSSVRNPGPDLLPGLREPLLEPLQHAHGVIARIGRFVEDVAFVGIDDHLHRHLAGLQGVIPLQ